MWLSGMQTPDFNTINLFRKDRLSAVIDDIFTQVVQMLVDQKIISLDVQYVDGTKIEANANKYTFVWKKSTQTNREKLDRKVKAILAEAEKELNLELGECKEEVMTPSEMSERADRILDEMDRRGISDKRLRKTDPDATFMRMKEDAMNNGQTKPGYNVQISTERQFITHYTMSWRPTDWGTFINHMDTFERRYGKHSAEVVADSGYGSEENYFVCPMGQHMMYVGDKVRTSDLGYRSYSKLYRAQNCEGCPLRGLCFKGKGNRTIDVNVRSRQYRDHAKELLTSERGLYHRSMRPVEPEAVFGQIKYDGRFRRFHYRGSKLTGAEFATIAIAHNIKKMISVMDAERNGRRLSPPRDVPPAARKRVPTSAACSSRA